MPGTTMASWGVRGRRARPAAFAARLRAGSPSVFCRVEDDHVLFDVRTVSRRAAPRPRPRDPVRDRRRRVRRRGLTPHVPAEHPHRVVATAGHVDHGKSSLIVALTGIDPDRWDEEKRRGLTIDLGYAWCALRAAARSASWTCPGTSGSSATCSPASGRCARAVRGGGGRGVEAPVRGAPADPGRPRRPRRRRRAHQDATSWTTRLLVLDAAGRSASTWRAPRWPTRRSCRCHRRPATGVDDIWQRPGRDARPRCRPPEAARSPAVRRPRLHDQGCGHGRHRHAHGRVPGGRSRGRVGAGRPSRRGSARSRPIAELKTEPARCRGWPPTWRASLAAKPGAAMCSATLPDGG